MPSSTPSFAQLPLFSDNPAEHKPDAATGAETLSALDTTGANPRGRRPGPAVRRSADGSQRAGTLTWRLYAPHLVYPTLSCPAVRLQRPAPLLIPDGRERVPANTAAAMQRYRSQQPLPRLPPVPNTEQQNRRIERLEQELHSLRLQLAMPSTAPPAAPPADTSINGMDMIVGPGNVLFRVPQPLGKTICQTAPPCRTSCQGWPCSAHG
jgi:hypothetical protein